VTPKQAAAILGCTWEHACYLCRSGRIWAVKRRDPQSGQMTYEIHPDDVAYYRDNVKRGRPWPHIVAEQTPTGWVVLLDDKPIAVGIRKSKVRRAMSQARLAWYQARYGKQPQPQVQGAS
jgi:hypothetical protein